LFSLLSAFFLANVLFSLHLPFYLIVTGTLVITFPLYLVGLWSYELEEYVSPRDLAYSAVFALISGQIALILSFWPVAPINGALALATVMYVLLGLGQLEFGEKLKGRVVIEHLAVAMVVFIAILVTTRWGV